MIFGVWQYIKGGFAIFILLFFLFFWKIYFNEYKYATSAFGGNVTKRVVIGGFGAAKAVRVVWRHLRGKGTSLCFVFYSK